MKNRRGWNQAADVLLGRGGMAPGAMLCFLTLLAVSSMSLMPLLSGRLTADRASLWSVQALYLAEAAVALGGRELRRDFDPDGTASPHRIVKLGSGECRYTIESADGPNARRLTGYGAVPNFENPRAVRAIQVTYTKMPIMMPNDFKRAIFAVQDVTGRDEYQPNLRPAEYYTGRMASTGWNELSTSEKKQLDFGVWRM